MTSTSILIAYDGSADAQAAIAVAGELLPGAEAVVLYARQPLESVAAHLENHPALHDLQDLDAASLDVSEQIAVEGARLAEEAGIRAQPMVSSTMATASEAIVEAAEEVGAALIVLGSRGRRGIRAFVLGSTSTNVLHHTRRPTLVIPSPSLAAARNAASKERAGEGTR